MSKTLLVTGFEPFGQRSCNASWEAVSLLPERIGDWRIVKRLLPVVFGEAAELVLQEAENCRADAIVLVGEAGNRDIVTPETTAVNLRRARIPDNRGNQPMDEPVLEGGAPTLSSTLPLERILQDCEERGLPVKLSHTAGEYVCNDLFYTVVARLGDRIPAGFIHVPLETVVSPPTACECLLAVVRAIEESAV